MNPAGPAVSGRKACTRFVTLQQFLLTARMLSEQQAELADLNGDEKITAVDLSLLKQILLS